MVLIIQNGIFIKNNCIESGFRALDGVIQGLGQSDFAIIGACPRVGKTDFALNIVNNHNEY
ncbi:DnaB-like helicase C-terminal domain-containing protein [Borreliella carolinensis]|uniref:DnaB-like helicase C-terminal domain-containing protein n=1 Tax=Borreliella carolinensis TaxID=478174 RepID=A0ACD5GKP1_9SPIR